MSSQSSQVRPVVVGYDGSPASRTALHWAAAHAVREHAPLRIVESFELFVARRTMAGSVPLEALRNNREQALKFLAEEVELQHPGLKAETVLVTQPAATVLIAESELARLVVLGTRGLGGWGGLLIGSVSVQVSAHAHCPVVVVPEDLRPRAHDKPAVVVGVDGSKVSEQAVGFAFDHAQEAGARVVAVHAWHIPLTPYGIVVDSTEVEESSRTMVAESLAGAIADHPDVDVEIKLMTGPPARELLAAGASADLVVVGSRGRDGFAGLLLGSVSQGVLHHATCPIAIVR